MIWIEDYKKKPNADIRALIAELGIRQFEAAEYCGLAESTFSRLLRKELNPDRAEEIINSIKKGAAGERTPVKKYTRNNHIAHSRIKLLPEIKPCPLCGASNELIMIELDETRPEMGLRCMWCGNVITIKANSDNDIPLKDVIMKWNYQADVYGRYRDGRSL